MYKQNKMEKTSVAVNEATQGETLERKLERMMVNKEPMKDATVPLLYTSRKDGVIPGTDIRTDRFKIAATAMDKTSGDYQAKRAQRWKPKEPKTPENGEGKEAKS